MLSLSAPAYHHTIRDVALIFLSLSLLPFSILLTILATIIRPGRPSEYLVADKSLQLRRQPRILVTGVGMEKGLFLARSFYIGGCKVIAADFEPDGIPVCGRFSKAVCRFYRLTTPNGGTQLQEYIDQIIQIVEDEDIDLWVSCSGVATAMEDAELMETIERTTACKTFQFNKACTHTLDNKYEFMKQSTDFDLESPKWYLLRSIDDVSHAVEDIRNRTRSSSQSSEMFIVKSVAMDDSTRGSLPLLSSENLNEMADTMRSLDYDGRQWILQEYIQGSEEYCTHAIVIEGEVKAFAACPSASILLHYQTLDMKSALPTAMRHYTAEYARKMYEKFGHFSGHLSFDFLVKDTPSATGVIKTIKPIECNPRCHTAVMQFRGMEREMTAVYLSCLYGAMSQEDIVLPSVGSQAPSHYWIAHDLVVLLIMPILQLFLRNRTLQEAISSNLEFWRHVLLWKEATFELWDPLPWLVLNHVYWPLRLAVMRWRGARWSQLNVSTTKMFIQ